MIKDLVSDDWIQTEKIYNHKRVRQVYYFSIEFLLGRLLNTNLLNCDMEELCRSALQDFGFDLEDIFPEEPDPGLGNGGLGRLAACYIDSMAALQLPGHGCSIRYQYGLFDQRIIDGQQVELPDAWLRNGFPWEIKKSDKAVDVRFGGHAYMRPGKGGALVCVHEQYNTVRAVPYDSGKQSTRGKICTDSFVTVITERLCSIKIRPSRFPVSCIPMIQRMKAANCG